MSTEWQAGREPPPETLPYSEKKQNATIGHLLLRQKFFIQGLPHIQASWFLHPFNQKIWTAMKSFHTTYGRAPKKDEILEAPSAQVEDQGTKNKLRAHATECLIDADHIGHDVIEKELTEWMHARIFFSGMVKSNQLYNRQDLKGALNEVRNLSKTVDDTIFGGDDEFDPTNFTDLFQQEEEEHKDAISLGVSALDKLLNPAAENGSLLKGDLTCLLGGINGGKSRTLVSIAAFNAKRKKNVLLVSHEDRKMNIYSGFWCHFLSNPAAGQFMTPQLLMQSYTQPAMRRKMEMILEMIWRPHLVYMPMMRAGLTVEEVCNAIRRKQDEFAAHHDGEGFDLVVDDYPGKLRTELGAAGKLENRHRETIVYQMFRDLASELNNHTLVAGQVNREGNKKMKGTAHHQRGEKELLTIEDKEESSGPMQSAVNVISINRDDEAKRKQCVTYGLGKSRSSETGYAVVCGSRLGSFVAHHDALGATWYRDSRTYSHIIDDLLRQYPGREVPSEALTGGE